MAQLGRNINRALLDQICTPKSPVVIQRHLHGANAHGTKATNAKQKPRAFIAGQLDHQTKQDTESQVGNSVRSHKPGGKRWLHYNQHDKPTASSIRERNITVSSYYNQTAIDKAAEKVSTIRRYTGINCL